MKTTTTQIAAAAILAAAVTLVAWTVTSGDPARVDGAESGTSPDVFGATTSRRISDFGDVMPGDGREPPAGPGSGKSAEALVRGFLETYASAGSQIPASVSLDLADGAARIGADAIGPLADAIRDADSPAAKGVLAHAIASIDGPEAAGVLLTVLGDEDDVTAQVDMADALGAFADPDAIRVLAEASLTTENPAFLASAAEVVGSHADKDIARLLAEDGGDGARAVISEIRGVFAEEALQELVGSSAGRDLIEAAATALTHYQGGAGIVDLASVMALTTDGGWETSQMLQRIARKASVPVQSFEMDGFDEILFGAEDL